MNREVLMLLLRQSFPDSDPDQRRVVARQAGDLADSGTYDADAGVALTPQTIVKNLADAPDDHGLVERWNWWMGALDLAHDGYERFRVRRWGQES
ncbi:MAG: hypothetical protein ABEJ68_11055 [Halobacteriaceae archaeon]